MKLVGEIGIDRKEYLWTLDYVDIIQIERGYDRRTANLWSATRWQVYHIMSSLAGSDQLAQKGINSPKDMLKFPWEKNEEEENATILTDEDIQRMKEDMKRYNEQQKETAGG